MSLVWIYSVVIILFITENQNWIIICFSGIHLTAEKVNSLYLLCTLYYRRYPSNVSLGLLQMPSVFSYPFVLKRFKASDCLSMCQNVSPFIILLWDGYGVSQMRMYVHALKFNCEVRLSKIVNTKRKRKEWFLLIIRVAYKWLTERMCFGKIF